MEIYWLEEDVGARVPSGEPLGGFFDREALLRLIENRARTAGIAALAEGARHYEVFASCA
jgi:hypothetical protein